jgi:2-polyprenyl-3-methyl-5-hydroxy-6-metoxy-1,4-benzoquinol methylase
LSFEERSYKKELLDGDGIPFADIKQNLEELSLINHKLGGHKINIKGIRTVLRNSGLNKAVRVLEIGCGGGDNLQGLKNYFQERDIPFKLTGVDIKKECIDYAKEQSANSGIEFICSDYKNFEITEKPHVIFSSLFCHHFTNSELVEMLKWKYENSVFGFFINDLRREPVAYHSIRILTKIFSKSYLVKNDAPLSVKRAFIKQDWNKLFSRAGIWDYEVEEEWAYRWLVTCKKEHAKRKGI